MPSKRVLRAAFPTYTYIQCLSVYPGNNHQRHDMRKGNLQPGEKKKRRKIQRWNEERMVVKSFSFPRHWDIWNQWDYCTVEKSDGNTAPVIPSRGHISYRNPFFLLLVRMRDFWDVVKSTELLDLVSPVYPLRRQPVTGGKMSPLAVWPVCVLGKEEVEGIQTKIGRESENFFLVLLLART